MLKTSQIILLLFLFNYLYCAPDRYIRDNKGKMNKNEYSARNEDYLWSNTDKNIDYDTPHESGSNTPGRKEDPDKHYYKEDPAGNGSHSSAVRQKHSCIVYNRPEEPDNGKKPIKKNKINNPPDKKLFKSRVEYTTYRVRNGDSLTGISRKFNLEVDYICMINRIKNPNDIFAGKILKLAPEQNTVINIKKNDDRIRSKPSFVWPLKDVISVKRDGDDGVRSIGIIITGKNGSKIYSSAAGTVKKIGQMRGFGNFIIVKHPERYFTIYSNLNDIAVSEGENVGTGKMIGRLDGNKLHFQIDNSGKPEDPLKYLSRRK